MASDMEILQQLEEEIGTKLQKIPFDEVLLISGSGFTVDEQGHIIGLQLYDLKLNYIPEPVGKLFHLKKLSLWGFLVCPLSLL